MPQHNVALVFKELVLVYSHLQSAILKQVKSVASSLSAATPGKFLLLQFGMAQVTQVGDTLSNLISQVNSMCATCVRNQKTS